MPLFFDWNENKAQANEKKPGVSFREAASVFSNPLARIMADQRHSADEIREIIIGHSSAGRVVIASFTETGPGRIRIISAQLATSREQYEYEEETGG